MSTLVPIILLTVIVIGFGAVMLFATSLLGPKAKADPAKMMPYECGIRGVEKSNTNVSVKFYLTAILFILFDIEIIFMFPWALIFRDALSINAVYILVEMLVFMAVLIVGLIYIIKAGALDWE